MDIHDDDAENHQRRMNYFLSDEYLSKKKKKGTPANDLTDAVIKYVKLNGGSARRISYGVRILESGQKISTGMRKGMEDVTCTMPVRVRGSVFGITVAAEIKWDKDKLSEYQEKRRDELMKCGGYYIETKSIDQFMKDWNELSQKLHFQLK